MPSYFGGETRDYGDNIISYQRVLHDHVDGEVMHDGARQDY